MIKYSKESGFESVLRKLRFHIYRSTPKLKDFGYNPSGNLAYIVDISMKSTKHFTVLCFYHRWTVCMGQIHRNWTKANSEYSTPYRINLNVRLIFPY